MKNNPATLLISSSEAREIFEKDIGNAIRIVELALRNKYDGNVKMPDKISCIFDEKSQNRINCMPAALLSEDVYGVKWVSVFPDNPKDGYKNVTGITVMSELKHGHPVAIMDSSYLTDIRTAAVGAVAAKYLATQNCSKIGFIGAGQQARRHLDTILCAKKSIRECYVSSRTEATVFDFIREEAAKHPDIKFINCGNDYESAVKDADIIVTATSTQEDLLKANWIKNGSLYIHVAGWEDEYAVAQKASKIVCDDWESVKHRTQTISRMYQEGILADSDIYANLLDIACGEKLGRENNDEFIYFCSVGLAYIDVMFAKYVYLKAMDQNMGQNFEFYNG